MRNGVLKSLLVLPVAALALSACGSGEDETRTDTATPNTDAPASITSPPPTETETASSEPEIGQKIDEGADRSDVPEEATASESSSVVAPRIVNGYQELAWEDLLPEGEEERLAAMYQQQMMELYATGGNIAEGSSADAMVQFGTFNTVKELDGQKIRLPGYTVPFEYGSDAKLSEFLLVPYFGACIHAPPPPPNQTIMVRTEKPIGLRDLAQAVWVEGTISIEIAESELADAAYVITLDELSEYDW